MNGATTEIESGERFAFGENWSQFLTLVDEVRINEAVTSIRTMLETDDLNGQRFADVGSGSGLFSLAARRLGAEVVSFDYDPECVACTGEMQRRYDVGSADRTWQVLQGSALDGDFISTLGLFDVVYSWGVLHHTGDMWAALGNVATIVAPNGRLLISIYNDQGARSKLWTRVKHRYNTSGPVARWALLNSVDLYLRSRSLATTAYQRLRGLPATRTPRGRGMDRQRDLVDWVGGYPFEVAKPELIFDFYRSRGFVLERLKTCGGGIGCNQFVFKREPLV
jgi:2-polyprenyl-6-hydroxyphenyl methylase/3-demethylubiquinone-9 3-methyltransferase